MRKLLYVPILHAEADLGSLAPAIVRHSIALCGQERWAEHQEVVKRFWQRVADYLLAQDPAILRIYQDGLAIEGEAGLKVVEEAARRGSPNYRLVLELARRGAIIRKTEDPALLMGERQNLLQAVDTAEQNGRKAGSDSRERSYQQRRDQLMKARDKFIAETINQTLKDGETGVLFLGAYHDVHPYLASDIAVREAKQLDKLIAYLQALFEPRAERWQPLADYLASPIVLSWHRDAHEAGPQRKGG